MCFCVVKSLQPLSSGGQIGKNIRYCQWFNTNWSESVYVCDKRAVIWHVTEIFLFTFSSLFLLLLALFFSFCSITIYDTTKRPPIAFVLLFTFQETMLDDDNRSSSATTTHQHISENEKAYCVSGGTQNYLVIIRRISGGLKNFLYHVRCWLQFQKKHRTSSERGGCVSE